MSPRSSIVSPLRNANRPRQLRRTRGTRGGKKPLKRLNTNNKLHLTNNQSQRHVVPNQPTDYHNEIAEFLALRKSDGNSAIAAIPSYELMYTRGATPRPLPIIPATSTSADVIEIEDEVEELEEGEIVDSQVSGIVSLLEESFAAVNRSQLIDFASPYKYEPFFEDRGTSAHGKVPKYSTFDSEADVSFESKNSSVISVDCSTTSPDDSVIFVSEKPSTRAQTSAKMATPDFLKSPTMKYLFKSLPPSPPKSEARKLNRKHRITAWKEKKAKEFAAKAAKVDESKPSTSSAAVIRDVPSVQNSEKVSGFEKRIILIDGSNFAMSYTDNYGTRKTDKDFSAEGNHFKI